MKTRAITGFFFIAVLIAAVLWGAVAFVSFFAVVAACAVYEFYSMVQTDDNKPMVVIGCVTTFVSLGLLSMVLTGHLPEQYLLLVFAAIFVVYINGLFRKEGHPISSIAYTLFGMIYAAVPFGIFMNLGFLESAYNAYVPLGFLIILWTNDTGAYLAGRSFGKRKLFERISPNKTWEGFWGGLLLASVASACLARYFTTLTLGQWIVVGLLISIFGTLGDLVESMLKRNCGVKDSGRILPGHGGLLDRFDGLLMAAPLVYLFLKFFVYPI
ncbi:phosphatidate cytidylyltransferase [Sphingobacterium paludis]|uniref:Phosphatidate cytidylyltransferase n=1 Tax=Sphingobacterium paludis TaxID=1476465 RepID=A0A4V3E1V6_9SPHI|nr:phosphatidate cytidylyltransferase [Sphingobacterium paludis]TDS14818.1 phosphatidate cytidylyltransferase [Sphingobacterium paludis]